MLGEEEKEETKGIPEGWGTEFRVSGEIPVVSVGYWRLLGNTMTN